MSTALVALGDMERMAQAVAASGLFGMKTKEQALALMIVAQSENRHPGSVAAEYHIIQGRPALKADAMLARFQQAGGVVEWQDYTDKKVSAQFHHPVNAPKPVLIEWTIEMATKAKLTGKDNWTNYPRQMLRARVISEGVRTVFPAVCVGVYTPEEVADIKDINPNPGRRTRLPKEQPQDAEIVAQAPGGTPPPHSGDASTAATGAPARTRSQLFDELCAQAYADPKLEAVKLLDKAEVQHVDEMSEADWASLLAMLRRKITKREVAQQA